MKNSNNLVSIIVPVYNVAKFLPDCLETIINQTYKNLEIILIDDGSTDSTGKICDNYAEKDSRVVVFHKKNGGVSSARNYGLKKYSGDFAIFIDGDDLFELNIVERLLTIYHEKHADLTCCGVKFRYLDGKVANECSDSSVTVFTKDEALDGFFCNQKLKNVLYGPYNKLFKRNLLNDLFFDESLGLGEDLLFVFKYICKSTNVSVSFESLYFYIKRENSATTREFTEKKLEFVNACKKILNISQLEFHKDYSYNYVWYYLQIINHTKLLLYNKNVRKNCITIYREYKSYLKNNKRKVWKLLSKKSKIYYYLLMYFPFLLALLKKASYRVVK